MDIYIAMEESYKNGYVKGFADAKIAKIISVNGYKAFHGTMRIKPKASVPAFNLTGDWLYRPETGCWYGMCSSFAAEICTILEVE